MRVRSLGMMGVAALLCAAAMTVVGCGGRQRPPERGSCRDGREWVAPAADSHGVMQDGYCRSTGA